MKEIIKKLDHLAVAAIAIGLFFVFFSMGPDDLLIQPPIKPLKLTGAVLEFTGFCFWVRIGALRKEWQQFQENQKRRIADSASPVDFETQSSITLIP